MTVQLRVPHRILSFLDGSQAWADMISERYRTEHGLPQEPNREPEAVALMHALHDAPARKDGSVVVAVTEDQLDHLESYAGAMAAGAKDNLGDYDEDRTFLAELNAATALLRQIERLRRS
jgi:hypothetical protein